MATDERDRITALYHAALERAAGDRAGFLREACEGDDGLRLEVESLLRHATASAALLETPADVRPLADSPTGMVGRAFGPYQITSLLGAGGMGEVYRARDRKLGRDVAIKILPQEFTTDPERRGRFAREARVLATLHHPHIAAIYGLEEVGDRTALVLELVEGPTLADRLEGGPLPLADVLSIARQLVEALDAAHLKGVIHRDLKPANIALEGTSTTAPGDSRVKVLDFGIAKIISTEEADPRRPGPATLDGTEDGRILGTPAYMSPEQARGQIVDKRSDIWACGCVLFEMLTGRRAFEGEGVTDTLARILEREVDWAALPPDTPPSIRALLQRCLQKDPQKRLRDIADARLEIDGGGTHESSFDSERYRGRLAWITAAFLVGAVLAAGTLILWQRRTAPTRGESLQFALGPPQATVFPLQNFGFAIAPDGRNLTMVAFADDRLALWVRPLGSDEPRRLRGTEQANNPFWSPDSRQIAFIAGGKLKTVGLSGEVPFEVCDTAPGSTGATWNRGGVILLGSSAGPLMKVSSTGGTPAPVTALKDDETSHRSPWFLPDGEHFLFLAMGRGPNQLRVGSLTSTDSTPVGTIRSNAAYSANHLLFVQGGLMAQPFDLRSRQLTGEPFPLNDQMTLMNSRGAFSVSDTGLLGYSARRPRTEARLTWMDRAGNWIGTAGEQGSYFDLALSPDDGQLAVSSEGVDGNIDIWVIDLARGGDKRRVTSDEGFEFHPDWSPNGKHLTFSSNRKGQNSVFVRPSDGSGSDVLLAEAGSGGVQAVWSPKDKSILFVSPRGDLWTKTLEDAQKPSLFLDTPSAAERSPAFSPDGRWIVYCSDRTGRLEIYVRPFPSKEPEHKISLDGGKMPRWRSDGEIFFLSLDGMLMSARFNAAASSPATIPRRLFQTGLALKPVWDRPYDVARNGQRFLIPVSREAPSRTITVVTNWTARLPK